MSSKDILLTDEDRKAMVELGKQYYLLKQKLDDAVEALIRIRDYDSFRSGPIAPRETPTTGAMREIAAQAIEEIQGE